MRTAHILDALADLAPASTTSTLDQLGARARLNDNFTSISHASALEVHDELHRDERLLRLGWGIIAGQIKVDDNYRRLRVPLVSRPIRLQSTKTNPQVQRITPAGDIQLAKNLEGTETGTALAEYLTQGTPPDLTELTEWFTTLGEAAGYSIDEIDFTWPQRDYRGLVLIPKAVVYIDRDLNPTPQATTLRTWATRPGLHRTALAAMYESTAEDLQPDAQRDRRPRTPLPLNRDQRDAVRLARSSPVTVVTGAPGCGKSHALAAIAHDEVAAGQSVLIATQSVHAADVIADLLDRHPGPSPVQFGDNERRGRFLTELSSGATQGGEKSALESAQRQRKEALALLDRVESELLEKLDLEARYSRTATDLAFLTADYPGLASADLDQVERHMALTESTPHSLWQRLKRWYAARALTKALGAKPGASLARSVDQARNQRARQQLNTQGGLRLADLWNYLDEVERNASETVGAALENEVLSHARQGKQSRRARGALATALRTSTRGDRSRVLASINAPSLVRAMPLWIGTAADVEEILPAEAGMFDLVILDEASHINQLRAAPVLARARRAVVAGDPRQLRFVAMSGSRQSQREVLAKQQLSDLADRLDTGRVSAYDLAVGAGPVVRFTDHHRSVPHLIGFAADRFYDRQVKPVTAHPRNDGADAITVHTVAASQSANGRIQAEVDAAVELLATLVDKGETSLAVISPFRAQAEAVEKAVVEHFDLDTIRRCGMRVGTVHSFQGSEAATVIASLGIGDADTAGRKRFCANQNLFNVMITRAREHLHVVTSLTKAEGLVGEFLQYAGHPPSAAPDGEGAPGWPQSIADSLSQSDETVRRTFQVGDETVDLVVGNGTAAVGVVASVHPDGPEAHLERQRMLRRGGWRLVDAFPSTYAEDPTRAALDLMSDLD